MKSRTHTHTHTHGHRSMLQCSTYTKGEVDVAGTCIWTRGHTREASVLGEDHSPASPHVPPRCPSTSHHQHLSFPCCRMEKQRLEYRDRTGSGEDRFGSVAETENPI